MAKGDTIVRCRANGAITSLLTTNLPDLVRPGSSAEPLENDGDLGARGLERLIFCAISFNGSPADKAAVPNTWPQPTPIAL